MSKVKNLGVIMSVCSTAIGNFAVAAASEFEEELARASNLTGVAVDTLRLRVYRMHAADIQTHIEVLSKVTDDALKELANE